MKLLVCIISFLIFPSFVAAQEIAMIPPVKPDIEAIKESGTAAAHPYDYQKIDFDVYAGGFHAVNANMELDYRNKGHYSIVFDAETRGMLGSLAPWKGTFSSMGWTNEGTLVPKLHESIALWRDEKEVKSYNYTKDGGFKNIVTLYKHKKPRTRVPKEELTKGTIDALSATVMIMEHISGGGKCEGETDIFDGKRRYKLVFTHNKFVTLKKSRYNAYSGAAAECTVEVKPIAGAWHKKPRGWLSIQEQGRERGLMPTVWFAQVAKNAVAVPVRVRVKTAYGTLFMHMTRYESGDIVLTTK